MERLEIQAHEAGQRLDRVLCARLALSRAQAKRLFHAGQVRRNGRAADKGELVAAGDTVELKYAGSDETALPDPSLSLQVRYEDAHLVVVDKPAGIASHPLRAGELGTLANGLLARYPDMERVGYEKRQPGLVNRLDNDTSGLVLAARSQPVFEALRRALEQGKISKTYLALCAVEVGRQTVALALSPSDKHRARVVVDPDGRPARSEIVSSRPWGELYLVEVRAPRAYRHQVRAHLAALGAPIVGDVLYGGLGGPRHYLHASELRFRHPVLGTDIQVSAALPDDWPLSAH